MPYKNMYGENCYGFGWLKAEPGSDDFKPTTGGNTVWAKNKDQAIRNVNRERKAFEKENPKHWKLRVNVSTVRRFKNREEHHDFDYGLYLMTV